jgi:hypothetical protein
MGYAKEGGAIVNHQPRILASICLVALALTGSAHAQEPVPEHSLIDVELRLPWTPSGLFVEVGDTLIVHSMGVYTSVPPPHHWWDVMGPSGMLLCGDPAFPVPHAPIGCLIARIGPSPPFPIGEFGIFAADASGELEYGTNNIDFDSNDGMLKVYTDKKSRNTASSVPPASREIDSVLRQNRPNPFNPVTMIQYSVKEAGHVELNLYDASGTFVTSLVSETKQPGEYTVSWDGRDAHGKRLPSGAYFYELKIGGHAAASKKMIMLK